VLILCLYLFSVNHLSSFGRSLLVVAAPKLLINQPDLCQQIIDTLQRLSDDREISVRFGVVKAINKATQLSLDVLKHSALFDILKRGIYDKNVSILNTISVSVLYCVALIKSTVCCVQPNILFKNKNHSRGDHCFPLIIIYIRFIEN
jgi:hypothetical protein